MKPKIFYKTDLEYINRFLVKPITRAINKWLILPAKQIVGKALAAQRRFQLDYDSFDPFSTPLYSFPLKCFIE